MCDAHRRTAAAGLLHEIFGIRGTSEMIADWGKDLGDREVRLETTPSQAAFPKSRSRCKA